MNRNMGTFRIAQSLGAFVLAFVLVAVDADAQRRRGDRPPGQGGSQSGGAPDGPRAIDGSGITGKDWGANGSQLLRWANPAYADGQSAPGDAGRPNARLVSQLVSNEERAIPNARNASAFLWIWGQFLDHDIDLTESIDEPYPVLIPAGDPFFDPNGTGDVAILVFRSIYDTATGTSTANPRQQINEITAFIDASNVYGSDAERANALRTLDGTGRLKTSEGDLLPFNLDGLHNAGGDSPALFVAGDIRANEQVGLTAMHTLFVREHNRLASLARAANPSLTGDEIYEYARRLVGAEMQAITYREFLPVLLGRDALSRYQGYRDDVNPGIANLFSTAAFRVGHTMLNEQLLRLEADGAPSSEGPLPLAEAFFRPDLLQTEGAMEALLRGFAAQRARGIDPFITSAVRNFLFGAPGAGGFDLASLNIQRGRDHGLPDYNTARKAVGLAPKASFAAISGDPDVQIRLEQAYGSVDNIDAWVGGLAEDRHRESLVGEFFHRVLLQQFENLRDGDPYWYTRDLDRPTQDFIESLTLGEIIRLNTAVDRELPRNVFRAPADAPF